MSRPRSRPLEIAAYLTGGALLVGAFLMIAFSEHRALGLGLAVLAVVVYHYLPGVLPGGFVGVDVFFVVSGFLITKLNLRRIHAGTFSFVDFYARRARRLLPAMALVVIVTLTIGGLLYSPAEQSALGHSAAAAALYGANIHHFLTTPHTYHFLTTHPLSPPPHTPITPSPWTLDRGQVRLRSLILLATKSA